MIFSEIKNVISVLDVSKISTNRLQVLQPLINFIQLKVSNQQDIRLNFICTHNSRRSHLAQIWSQTLAAYFDMRQVFCYSGGTETTELFPKVLETLKISGFKVEITSDGINPIYNIYYSSNDSPIKGFSKIYNNDFNPQSEFAAILTCSQADADCPLIAGAEQRISIPFDDPKLFDKTTQQDEKYKERSIQIATELYYVFSKIKL